MSRSSAFDFSNKQHVLAVIVVWVVVAVCASVVTGVVVGEVHQPLVVYGSLWVFSGIAVLPLLSVKKDDSNVLDPF